MVARFLRSCRAASLIVLWSGCGVEVDRPGGPEVLIPDQVPVVWDQAYNGVGDGLGALVPVDVMAYDGATGRPLAGLHVHVWTADAAAMPVGLDRVTVVDGQQDTGAPPFPSSVASPVQWSVRAWSAGAPAADGPYAEPVPAEVQFWDAVHDQFVAVTPADDVELSTDSGGVARLYLFVDAFPMEGRGAEGAMAPIQVIAAVGDDVTVFSLVPR